MELIAGGTPAAPGRNGGNDVLQESEVEVFLASLLNGADCKINARVNPLNVTDQLFRRTDITGASDAAVFALICW